MKDYNVAFIKPQGVDKVQAEENRFKLHTQQFAEGCQQVKEDREQREGIYQSTTTNSCRSD